MGGSDDPEGGVRGSTRNRCQGCEQEVQEVRVDGSHGGDDKYAEVGRWKVFGWEFLSHTEDQEKKGDYLAIMLRSTDKEIIIRKLWAE